MPKVSVNILTKNRADILPRAVASVASQSFKDFEVVVINDGSTDGTQRYLQNFGLGNLNLKVLNHQTSIGITSSRQEALATSAGEYIAILDDDDEWRDVDKLKKQVEFLDAHTDYVLVGGGIRSEEIKYRPETNKKIRSTMLYRNNFFTSTVMFRREQALEAGGFINNWVDLAEDYDLWLRLGRLGKMHNFQEVFVNYSAPSYNKDRFKKFLEKQLSLIKSEKQNYPGYFLASLILKIRLLI